MTEGQKQLGQLTVEKVLQMAIRKEAELQRIYTGLSHSLHDSAARDGLQRLSRQAYEHQKLLEQYMRGEPQDGLPGRSHSVDYKITELLSEPVMSPEMKLKDVFLLAANRGKASHEYYLGLARIHPEGEVKKLLEELAALELKRKQHIESLYVEVAFPQIE